MATETFSGTVTDTAGGAETPLVALNRIDQTGLTEVTPYLGAVTIGASTIASGTVDNGVMTVTGVKTSQTALPRLAAGQQDLIARRGTAASTWLQKVQPGDTLSVTDSLAPYGIDQIRTAVSGGAYLAQNGAMAVPVQGGGENNVAYPVVGLGVSKDGTHAIMAPNGRWPTGSSSSDDQCAVRRSDRNRHADRHPVTAEFPPAPAPPGRHRPGGAFSPQVKAMDAGSARALAQTSCISTDIGRDSNLITRQP
jgi:hypothetical protein